MHAHGSKCLAGPVRGTPGWWQGLGKLDEPASPPPEKPKGSSRIRADLVARVRREIAAGTYDTPERWQAALDRLLERLCED